ncbi:MAG: UDP-N-acetylglucosamine 2-epimerase (non-hydrolyzing) [Candidatus Sumerlaeota bacterium]|nr:UDP-N-acetylglucosamine 2-epimerase (non-hydrolyzing) [Candidatus Sumerlaeota bacterium]
MLLHVVGARPNFMKMAPVFAACARAGVPQKIIHTGQHYDRNMSDVFFQQLEIPAPDINLEVNSPGHSAQTANVMLRFEGVIEAHRPRMVAVYGDVNSTMATAIVCAKRRLPVAHVEAGLRSFDRRMPEEINRLITDQISDLLFTPSEDGDANLLREGVAREKIHFVGNAMIDTLVKFLPAIEQMPAPPYPSPYAVATLHRPSNVDDPEYLKAIMESLGRISRKMPVIFPIHPRTRQRLAQAGAAEQGGALNIIDPIGYLEFMSLVRRAALVITDSGGIQEETTYLGIPCLTLRENTERPITVTMGTNVLIGLDLDRLEREVNNILSGAQKPWSIPPLWDGHAGERMAAILKTAIP